MTHSKVFTEIRPTRAFSARTTAPNIFVLHGAAMTNLDALSQMIVAQTRQVSAHGGFKDKRGIGWIDEENRAWSLSDAYWDSRAFTLENANDQIPPYSFSGETQEQVAQWIADVSRRRGIWPHRSGDPKTWTVIGHREVYTIHGGSYATACPQLLDLNWITTRAQQLLTKRPSRSSAMPSIAPRVHNGAVIGHRIVGESGKVLDVNTTVGGYVQRLLSNSDGGMLDAQIDQAVAAIAQVAPSYSGTVVGGGGADVLAAIAALDKQADTYQAQLLTAIAGVDEATLATFGLKRL